jgi:hypothetical protein
VADARGLSYYSDVSVMKRLFMDSATFDQARRNLVAIGLIAYQKPLYQVLALGGSFEPTPIVEIPAIPSAYRPTGKSTTQPNAKPLSGRGGMQSVKKILKTIMEDSQ